MKIGTIILAAGGSSRMMGEAKQLLEFDGCTLLRRAVKTALSTESGPVLVVLGASAERLLQEMKDLPVLVEINQNWQRGIGSSIKAGLSKLLAEEPDIEAAILTLADQPLIAALHLARLVEIYLQNEASVIASRYEDTVGVRALFARKMFDDLVQIPDDKPPKSLLLSAQNVKPVSLPEASIDIDTPQDYEQLK